MFSILVAIGHGVFAVILGVIAFGLVLGGSLSLSGFEAIVLTALGLILLGIVSIQARQHQ